MESEPISYSGRQMAVLYTAWLGMFVFIFLRAWVCEDAYITFRVIDNFFQGYGLRWNIGERVQVYTHPLWLLLHLPVYALWRNLFQVNITLSIVCSMAALLVVLASVRKPLMITLGCFFLPLALSKSFMDYTGSGLENPLSYLLFAGFGYVILNKRGHRYFWLFGSSIAALALLNRLDTIILYAPAIIYLTHRGRKSLPLGQIVLGCTPLIAWFCFALFYYGFIFPNTKYAKLDTGFDLFHYLEQGLHYGAFTLAVDSISVLLMLSPLLFIIPPTRKHLLAPGDAPLLPISVTIGIFCYGLYVLYVGGDYMAGRFWSLPVFAAVWLGYVFMPNRTRHDFIFAAACVFCVAFISSGLIQDIRQKCKLCVVTNGHLLSGRITFAANKLVINAYPLRLRSEGNYPFARDGKRLAAENPPPVRPMYYIGMSGYYAGPHVTLIDELALADPLLARLPASPRQNFYIGHFRRRIPLGYMYLLQTGSPERMDQALAAYYDRLHLITSGYLWDPERLQTILAFNLGMYDHWKQDYLKTNRP